MILASYLVNKYITSQYLQGNKSIPLNLGREQFMNRKRLERNGYYSYIEPQFDCSIVKVQLKNSALKV